MLFEKWYTIDMDYEKTTKAASAVCEKHLIKNTTDPGGGAKFDSYMSTCDYCRADVRVVKHKQRCPYCQHLIKSDKEVA